MRIKKFEPQEGKEDDLQVACMQWMKYAHPDVLAFHVPNGGKRNAREGAKFKRMGVLAGVPDVLILEPKQGFNGFAVELKVKGGKLSKNQKDRLKEFAACNWKILVCYSFDEFEHHLNEYLK
jgi:hypothetical protein